MWMYTASPNPLVLLSPELLGLKALKSEAPEVVALVSDTKGSHSVQQNVVHSCPTQHHLHPVTKHHHQRCYKIFSLTVLMQEIKQGSNCLRGKQRGKQIHSNRIQDIYSILRRITRFWVCSDLNKMMKYQSSAEWNSSSPPSSGGSWGAWKSWHQGCWLAADWDSQALTLPSACQEGCRGAGPANWLETREVSLTTLLCFRWNFIKICLANISISTKKNFVEIFLTSSRDLSLMINLVSLVKLKMLVF